MIDNKSVKTDKYGISINGEYKVLLCSSLFYFRIPRSEWEDRIKSLLLSGYNTADVYFPWNFHETGDGEFDFTGERDVKAFLRLCAQYGLYVIVRFGPYICSEWTGGAIPARVAYKSEKIRTTDPYFIEQTKKWYAAVLPLIAEFQIEKNGTVILAQLENELDFFDCDDVEGYISVLRDAAAEQGVSVPMFCCAGQGNVVTSGGKVRGIMPTYNFYPSLKSSDFDGQCAEYSRVLQSEGLPLLITETGRETSLHKREFAAGAKLVGAYNQIAGSNFGYYQAVNNWGSVTAAIVTEYDFNSMIDVLGRFTAEVGEARLFTRMLSALGDRVSRALPSAKQVSVRASFKTADVINVLELYGGGRLVCVCNLSDEDGTAVVDDALTVTVGKEQTLLLPFGVHTEEFEIISSNFEIYSLKPLILYGDGAADIRLRVGGSVYNVTDSGCFGGVEVSVYSKKEMLDFDGKEGGYKVRTDGEDISAGEIDVGTVSFPTDYKKVKETSFEANGIWEGGALYKLHSESSRLLFLNPADFISVYIDGEFVRTTFERGKSKIVDVKPGDVLVKAEKWGACNFDESRESSLRIKSTRGVAGFYNVERELPLSGWRLTFSYENTGKELISKVDKFDPLLDLNGYNSTRMPFEGVLYLRLDAYKGKRLFLSLENGTAEASVYVSGEYAGAFRGDRNFIDLSRFADKGGVLQLLVRKRDWAERVGNATLIVAREAEVEMCSYGKSFMRDFNIEDIKRTTFPIELKAGETVGVTVDMKPVDGRNCLGVATGENYKLTAVCGGEVVARMIAPDWQGVTQTGGSKENFLIPAAWCKDGKLKLLVESIGENTCLDFRFKV